jgi:alkylation response protein AidB-like acyl-CoA dehydrogenase
MCELLVGLPDVHILGVDDEVNGFLCIYIESSAERPGCAHCGVFFLNHKAAWAIDNDDGGAGRLTSMAYSYSTGLAERITAECLHFHGGIGYTLEHGIQLYFRRAAAWPLALGDPRAELSTLATRMFGERGNR